MRKVRGRSGPYAATWGIGFDPDCPGRWAFPDPLSPRPGISIKAVFIHHFIHVVGPATAATSCLPSGWGRRQASASTSPTCR